MGWQDYLNPLSPINKVGDLAGGNFNTLKPAQGLEDPLKKIGKGYLDTTFFGSGIGDKVFGKGDVPMPGLSEYAPRPEYSSLLNPRNPRELDEAFRLKGQGDVAFRSNLGEFDRRLGNINLDRTALNELQNRALTQGPTQQAQYLTDAQKLMEQDAMGRAVGQNKAGLSSTYSDIARRGGLSSGARERLGAEGARNLSGAQQGIGREGMQSRLGILSTDEAQKLDTLRALPGMQVQSLQPELEKTRMYGTLAESEAGRGQNLALANRQYDTDINKFNLGTTFSEIGRQDQLKQDAYLEEQKRRAAADQAAMLRYEQQKGTSGPFGLGGDSYICNAVHEVQKFSDTEWKLLGKFLSICQRMVRTAANEYFKNGSELVKRMHAANFDFATLRPHVLATIQLIRERNYAAAVDLYWKMAKEFFDKFYPEAKFPEPVGGHYNGNIIHVQEYAKREGRFEKTA